MDDVAVRAAEQWFTFGDFAADVAGVRDARRGDAVVEASEGVDGCLGHGVAVGVAGDIGGDGDGVAAFGLDQGDGFGGAFVVGQCGDDDRSALAGEPEGALAPHAAGCAGDDGDLALKAIDAWTLGLFCHVVAPFVGAGKSR